MRIIRMNRIFLHPHGPNFDGKFPIYLWLSSRLSDKLKSISESDWMLTKYFYQLRKSWSGSSGAEHSLQHPSFASSFCEKTKLVCFPSFNLFLLLLFLPGRRRKKSGCTAICLLWNLPCNDSQRPPQPALEYLPKKPKGDRGRWLKLWSFWSNFDHQNADEFQVNTFRTPEEDFKKR